VSILTGTDDDPNGIVNGTIGQRYINTDTRERWDKIADDGGNTGWI
jgi:hypothetical protein